MVEYLTLVIPAYAGELFLLPLDLGRSLDFQGKFFPLDLLYFSFCKSIRLVLLMQQGDLGLAARTRWRPG